MRNIHNKIVNIKSLIQVFIRTKVLIWHDYISKQRLCPFFFFSPPKLCWTSSSHLYSFHLLVPGMNIDMAYRKHRSLGLLNISGSSCQCTAHSEDFQDESKSNYQIYSQFNQLYFGQVSISWKSAPELSCFAVFSHLLRGKDRITSEKQTCFQC